MIVDSACHTDQLFLHHYHLKTSWPTQSSWLVGDTRTNSLGVLTALPSMVTCLVGRKRFLGTAEDGTNEDVIKESSALLEGMGDRKGAAERMVRPLKKSKYQPYVYHGPPSYLTDPNRTDPCGFLSLLERRPAILGAFAEWS